MQSILFASFILLIFYGESQLLWNETCETVGSIKHLYWNELASNINIASINYSLNVDIDLLSITIDIDLPYLGSSFGDKNSSIPLGTTYILDFNYFDTLDNIREPGLCQNRLSSDFNKQIPFYSLWNYSDTPYNVNHLNNKSYLAYPPSADFWNLSISNNNICGPIHYHGHFTWNELIICNDYNNMIKYNKININDNWINLTGTFYVDIISPMNSVIDKGVYYVYNLINVPFIIPIRNSMNMISTMGINLFTMTIIDIIYDDEYEYKMIVLTESADSLMLYQPLLLTMPESNGMTINVNTDSININGNCLNTASNNICSQLWEITVNHTNCPLNIGGVYGLQFYVTCNPYIDNNNLCDAYMDKYGDSVRLTTDLIWSDQRCDGKAFDVEFNAMTTFYKDTTYEYKIDELKEYKIDETVYFELQINESSSSEYELLDIEIENMWICTINAESKILSIEDSDNPGSGMGCLAVSANIDSGFPIHIIENNEINELKTNIWPIKDISIYPTIYENNIVRISFDIDKIINRDQLYIHSQLNIKLKQKITKEFVSQTRHFIDFILIDNDNNSNLNSFGSFSLKQLIVIVIVENICIFIACFMVLFYKKWKQKKIAAEQRKRRKERHLKRAKTLSSIQGDTKHNHFSNIPPLNASKSQPISINIASQQQQQEQEEEEQQQQTAMLRADTYSSSNGSIIQLLQQKTISNSSLPSTFIVYPPSSQNSLQNSPISNKQKSVESQDDNNNNNND